jgi:hypothetical protein
MIISGVFAGKRRMTTQTTGMIRMRIRKVVAELTGTSRQAEGQKDTPVSHRRPEQRGWSVCAMVLHEEGQ